MRNRNKIRCIHCKQPAYLKPLTYKDKDGNEITVMGCFCSDIDCGAHWMTVENALKLGKCINELPPERPKEAKSEISTLWD